MRLSIAGLCFHYKNAAVLNGVDLEVESGSFCALMGANGAGKSTLVRCVNGILRPRGGAVAADGIDLIKAGQRERARLIGYVPQNALAENSALNVYETVLSGRVPYMRGRMSSADRDIAMQTMDSLALSPYATRQLAQLSGGERQRVFIARAIAQNPKIMLLDEPTNNLDMRYQQQTLELIKELSEKQKITVLAIIHDLNSVIVYADQAALLKEGRIVCSGRPEEVLNGDNIAAIFRVDVRFAALGAVNYVVPQRKRRGA